MDSEKEPPSADGGSGQLFVSHYKRGDKYEPFDHALDAEHGMLIRTVIEERGAPRVLALAEAARPGALMLNTDENVCVDTEKQGAKARPTAASPSSSTASSRSSTSATFP